MIFLGEMLIIVGLNIMPDNIVTYQSEQPDLKMYLALGSYIQ